MHSAHQLIGPVAKYDLHHRIDAGDKTLGIDLPEDGPGEFSQFAQNGFPLARLAMVRLKLVQLLFKQGDTLLQRFIFPVQVIFPSPVTACSPRRHYFAQPPWSQADKLPGNEGRETRLKSYPMKGYRKSLAVLKHSFSVRMLTQRNRL